MSFDEVFGLTAVAYLVRISNTNKTNWTNNEYKNRPDMVQKKNLPWSDEGLGGVLRRCLACKTPRIAPIGSAEHAGVVERRAREGERGEMGRGTGSHSGVEEYLKIKKKRKPKVANVYLRIQKQNKGGTRIIAEGRRPPTKK